MKPTFQTQILELEQSGLTLTAIAGRIGLSVQGASDIKQGRTKEPRGKAAIALANLHRNRMKRQA